MGVYQYTLRAETKVVDGIELGRYGYAYKHSWDHTPGGRSRRVRAAESLAETAQYHNRHIRHFIQANSFADAAKDGHPIFQIDGEPVSDFAEAPKNAKVIGKLVKQGRSYAILLN